VTTAGDRAFSDFADFHLANPHVYAKLVEIGRELIARGVKKFSITSLYERLRWQIWTNVYTDDDYKLNNNYQAFYARLITEEEPDFAGIFTFRTSRADG
jgi:hypothetical protein